jgi:hypothetical protein
MVDINAECQANRDNAAADCKRCGRKNGEGCGGYGPYANSEIVAELDRQLAELPKPKQTWCY